MKRMTITVLSVILATCALGAQTTSGHAKSTFGIDICAALKHGNVKIHAGHRIKDRWSAGGWFAIRLYRRTEEEEEIMHRDEFSDGVKESTSDTGISHTGGLYVRFWPSETYDGMFLSTGVITDGKGRDDVSLGIGYNMKIWKRIRASIGFEMNIIESFRTQKFKGEGSGLCICYIF